MADSEAVKRAKERLQKEPVFDRIIKRFKDEFWELVKDELPPDEYEKIFDEFREDMWDDIKDDVTKQELEKFEKEFDEFFGELLDIFGDSDLE